jgi:hypothetical protein
MTERASVSGPVPAAVVDANAAIDVDAAAVAIAIT